MTNSIRSVEGFFEQADRTEGAVNIAHAVYAHLAPHVQLFKDAAIPFDRRLARLVSVFGINSV